MLRAIIVVLGVPFILMLLFPFLLGHLDATLAEYLTKSSAACDASVADGIAFLRERIGDDDSIGRLNLHWLHEDCDSPCPLTRPHSSHGKGRGSVAPCARLMRLVSHGLYIRRNATPSDGGLHMWNDTEFPGYRAEDVFFLKHPNALVQTYQHGPGLSGMHAPAMVQHYALVRNNRSAPMLDVVSYVRNNVTGNALKSHIFGSLDYDSATFLSRILAPCSRISYSVKGDGVRQDYDDYGPGLVHNMMLQEDFTNMSVRKHYGRPHGRLIGRHSMALVGHRFDKKKRKLYYLLQNWWKEKQFVEVDMDYLIMCGAYIRFIQTPQDAIPNGLASTYFKYHALDFVDAQERDSFPRNK